MAVGHSTLCNSRKIWNPHSYDPTSTATINRSLGNPRPTNFQIATYTAKVNVDGTTLLIAGESSRVLLAEYKRDRSAVWENFGNPSEWAGTQYSLNGEGMQFSLNTPGLFREPTLLIEAGVPSGSQLQGFNNRLGATGWLFKTGLTSTSRALRIFWASLLEPRL